MKIIVNIRPALLILLLFAGIFLASCQKDLLEPVPDGAVIKPGLNLSINSLSSEGGSPLSRASISDADLRGTNDERQISSLDLFLFNEQGTMVAHSRLEKNGNNIGGVSNVFPATSDGNPVNVDISALLNRGGYGKRTLAVVANWDARAMGGELKERVVAQGNSLSTLEGMVIDVPFTTLNDGTEGGGSGEEAAAFGTQSQDRPHTPRRGGLISYGKSQQMDYTNVAPALPAFEVKLERMVARVELIVKVSGAMADKDGLITSRIYDVRVVQAASKAFLVAQPNMTDATGTMPEYTGHNKKIERLFHGASLDSIGSFKRNIYLPENNLSQGSYNKDNSTYLLVCIKRSVIVTNIYNKRTTFHWYRFRVNEGFTGVENNTPLPTNYRIKRNTFYRIVGNISTMGTPTPETAVDMKDSPLSDSFYTLSYNIAPNINFDGFGIIGTPPIMGNTPQVERYSYGARVFVLPLKDVGAPGRDIYPVIFNTKNDGTGKTYFAGDTLTITEHTTLYARLRPAAPRITWGRNGGLSITYDPRDAGYFFKYGSVVGIRSSHERNADLTAAPVEDNFDRIDVRFNPTDNNFFYWNSVPYEARSVNIDYSYHNASNVAMGLGDPCRLVGFSIPEIRAGNIDNGEWRLPTANENISFTIPSYSNTITEHWWAKELSPFGVAGAVFPTRKNESYETFLVAAGSRDVNGKVINQGTGGNLWGAYGSSSQSPLGPDYSCMMDFSSTHVAPTYNENSKQNAYSIRCVRQGVPRITIEMGSDGQPMLALTDNPKDGGLLFKYGSTVGVYSGHNANLTASNKWKTDTWDSGDVAFNYTTYPSSSITNANMILPAPDNIKAITADFHSQSVGRLEGLGDPCRLVGLTMTEIKDGTRVDNGMWRLPTRDEVAEMMGGMDWDPASCIWGSQVTSPWEIEGFELKGRNRIFKNFIPPGGLRNAVGSCTAELAGLDGRLHYWLANTPRLFSLRGKATVWENEDVTGSVNRGYMTGRICVRQKPGE